MVLNHYVSLGIFLAFSSFANILTSSLKHSVNTVVKWGSDKVFLDRIIKFTEHTNNVIIQEEQKITLNEPIRKIEFKNVTFSYGNNNVINNLCFTIKTKTILSIMGDNGSGKSTLLKLITKELLPDSGDILINDYNLADISYISLQERLAFLRQKSILFPISIIDNLTLNSTEVLHNDTVLNLCKNLGLYDEILSRQEGFKTLISESDNVSIGQEQKVNIIRSLAKNSDLILLDEPTSNLDAESKIAFMQCLRILSIDKIVVFVTHSLEEALACDSCLNLSQKQE